MPAHTFPDSDEQAYQKARKLGSKAYHAALARRESPYLKVLDEDAPDHLSYSRVSLDLITVPLERVIGTATRGRVNAFAPNFMPLLDITSEFARKWCMLYGSVMRDGVREPVRMLEYMNRYYVVEGNKRISVLKYSGALMIEANVTRVIPKRTDAPENRLYFEYLDFYRDTHLNTLYFSNPGDFEKLVRLTGHAPGVRWEQEDAAALQTCFFRFQSAFELLGGDLSGVEASDAFLLYLEVYGYQPDDYLNVPLLKGRLGRLREEFRARAGDEAYQLLMTERGEKPNLIRQIIHPAPQKLNVAFINNHSPQTSGWTYWHALGRNHVDSALPGRIVTQMVSDVAPEACEEAIETCIKNGANLVFTTSPNLLGGAMKAAMAHPEVRVLNCSLLPSYRAVRSYYLRLYEAKFILGAIAGAMSDNHRVGYIADYPVYGAPASINAFALGARMTDPRAKVYLEWSTVEGTNPEAALEANDVRVISNRDISAPAHGSMAFGLYVKAADSAFTLAMPVWNWGRVYVDLIRRVQSGVWAADADAPQALNYWWGMDAGAIDVFYTSRLDAVTRRLADLLRREIARKRFLPFSETIEDQQGRARCQTGQTLSPADIIAMDYLVENVVGDIPDLAQMKPEAAEFVRLQGVRSIKPPDASEICWTDPIPEEPRP